MGYLSEQMLENFKMNFSTDAAQIMYYEPIGYDCLEIKLMDGTTVIYDDIHRSARNLPKDSNRITEEEFRREFGYRLRRIMEYKHVSQLELSERTDIAQYLISDYINGKRTPSSYTLDKIAKALRCSVDDFRYV